MRAPSRGGGWGMESNLDNAAFGLLRVQKYAKSCSTPLKGVSPLSSPCYSPLPTLQPCRRTWVSLVSSWGHTRWPLCCYRLLEMLVPVEVQCVQMTYHRSHSYFILSPAGFLAIGWQTCLCRADPHESPMGTQRFTLLPAPHAPPSLCPFAGGMPPP